MNIETAKRLFEYRKANGFSQEELAEKIGVSRQAISKWERSESSPDTDNLIALAKLYGTTIDELLNGSDAPKKIAEEPKAEEPEDATDDINDNDINNEDQNNNDTNYNSNINFKNGFNVEDGKDKVHIGWDGIHVESKTGDNVHVSGRGVHVESKDGHFYNGSVPPVYSPKPEKNPWLHALLPIAIIFLYLFFGFFTHRGWEIGWIMFLLIPVIETAVTAVKTKNPSHFCYPVFIAALYLSGGMIFHVWHPTWILFITIPMYYIICDTYKKTHKNKVDDFTQYNSADGTYYHPNGTAHAQSKSKSGTVAAVIISIICGITIIAVVAISCTFSFLGNGLGGLFENLPDIIEEGVKTSSYNYDNAGKYTAGGAEVNANGIREISIDWVSNDITVEYYDGDKIAFSEPTQSSENKKLHYRVDGDELKIKFCKSGTAASGLSNKQLTVRLPQGFILNELDIDGVSADTNINGISVNSVNISTVSGNTNASGTFNDVDLNGVSGNYNIQLYNAPNEVETETVSGDCTISVPKDINGFTINCSTVSGEVNTNEFKVTSITQKHGNGTYTYGNGSTEINVNSVSGDFEIQPADSGASAVPVAPAA